MRDDIVEKLKQILIVPVRTEERVVYIMVEVRKLMEHANLPKKAFPMLRFFCDWIVHSELTRRENTAVVKAMNDIFAARVQGQRMGEEERQKLSSLFSFDAFRDELLEFLSAQGLKAPVLELPPEWIVFIKHYASVVAECPIIYSKNDMPLKWMDRVVVSAYDVDEGVLEYYRAEHPFVESQFGMRWTFFKGQRQVMKWEAPMMYEASDSKDGLVRGICG